MVLFLFSLEIFKNSNKLELLTICNKKETMQPIENIMKLRKGYTIKLYEYFNHVQHKLDDKINNIKAQAKIIYEEENNIWNKLQEKKSLLQQFENQIIELSQSKGILDKKRIDEVKNLREKLELQYQDTQKGYQKLLEKNQIIEKQWNDSIRSFLLTGAHKQKILIRLNNVVENTFPDLKEYCSHWKDEPIQRLDKILSDAKHIDISCISILSEIKSLSLLNMDEQRLADQKTIQIPKNCEILAKVLDGFITNNDFLDILEKTKENYPFIADFLILFKDSGFTSLRTSIRLVNNINVTEKKLIIIADNFQQLQIIFTQVLNKLHLKKTELMDVCTNANILAETTCDKWLNTQYQSVLNVVEQINQKRNEFVVNETIL